MQHRTPSILLAAMLFAGCGCDEERASPPTTEAAPAPAEPAQPAEEACAQVIVVAWQGAESAPPSVTRSEDEARARADDLRRRIEELGESFVLTAHLESDSPAFAQRNGLLGTYSRDEWPREHAAVRDAIFNLEVFQISEPIYTPYGWVIAQRCPVEKVHTRHILVRYAGARNAGPDVTRSREEAHALAERIRARVTAPGADFAAIARETSEDASAGRGGDLGSLGHGRMSKEYEEVAFRLQPNEISPVVSTEYGFHIIQRLP